MPHKKEPQSFEDCAYFSRRAADGSAKYLVVWVDKADPATMLINYTCLKCGHEDSLSAPFFLPFTFKCSKCGNDITLAPLKGKKKGFGVKKKKAKKGEEEKAEET